MTDRFFDWLLWLGDPQPRNAAPGSKITPASLERLVTEGERHRVLPAMMRNLRRAIADRGAAGLIDAESAAEADRLVVAALERGDLAVARLVGMAELLRSVQQDALEAFAAGGIDWLILKGTSFADRLYADPALRPFDDIDLLVPVDALPAARTALAACGLAAVPETSGKYAGRYAEEKWSHPLLGSSPVELHWDLVNSPKIRRFISVDYRRLAAARTETGALDPAALLYVAAIHAVTGHGFDRLQQVFDLLQAARGVAGPLDIGDLDRLAAATGGRLALATALAIAANLTRDPAMTELARAVAAGYKANGLAWIFGRLPALTAQSAERSRHSWRRQLCRELLLRMS